MTDKQPAKPTWNGPSRRRRVLIAAVLIGAVSVATGRPEQASAAEAAPPPVYGVDTPAEPCVVCHALRPGDPFRVAPTLFNIVGAEKARAREWYGYSAALMTKGGTWTEEDLDAFLKDASAFAPGSTKSIRVTDAAERRRIIDFLKTLTP